MFDREFCSLSVKYNCEIKAIIWVLFQYRCTLLIIWCCDLPKHPHHKFWHESQWFLLNRRISTNKLTIKILVTLFGIFSHMEHEKYDQVPCPLGKTQAFFIYHFHAVVRCTNHNLNPADKRYQKGQCSRILLYVYSYLTKKPI